MLREFVVLREFVELSEFTELSEFVTRPVEFVTLWSSTAAYLSARRLIRPVHTLTKSALDIFSTLPKKCFHWGKRFPQIHLLHQCSPLSRPSLVAHMDCQATRSGRS